MSEWIKGSERLPIGIDADTEGCVWMWQKNIRPNMIKWQTVRDWCLQSGMHELYWMQTGIKCPKPPEPPQ